MRLKIAHTTTYRYDEPVRYGLQRLRLTPKQNLGQSVLSWSLTLTGGRIEAEYDDHYANRVSLARIDDNAKEITIVAEGEVETEDRGGVLGESASFAPLWWWSRATSATKAGAGVRKLARTVRDEPGGDVARLHALMRAVGDSCAWELGGSHVHTTAEEALEAGKGVCQDHAHIFLAAARHLGHPARYVSGYLMMDDLPEQEATHAWAEAHLDGLGWVGFDVSNGISPDARYVRVATGLDYSEAAPMSGLRYGEGAEALSVKLTVTSGQSQSQSQS